MREMKTILLFHQLRLHCCKQQHGRTFRVKTAINAPGGAVVGFFGGDRRFPKACDSFEKLKGDNSVLASRCVEWGRENGAVYIPSIHRWYDHWITWPGSNVWQCDGKRKDLSRGDFWKIYVR